MGFRIELPAYRGPLDLLLYLVRRQEVSLVEISLAKMVDQYLEYLDVLKELDLGDVGDFIDLASTLVEMKSQAVLPKLVEEEEEDEIADPQAELVERLLQYKEIRDAATVLDEMGTRWQQRYERLSDDLATPPGRSRRSADRRPGNLGLGQCVWPDHARSGRSAANRSDLRRHADSCLHATNSSTSGKPPSASRWSI